MCAWQIYSHLLTKSCIVFSEELLKQDYDAKEVKFEDEFWDDEGLQLFLS